MLEGGRVRSKNSVNVAQKNVSDLMVAWVGYFLFGFLIMYGISMPVSGTDDPSPLQFLFQLGFCATAASIVSGGIAERMKFIPYLVMALFIGGFLFPISGRLVWGDTFAEIPFTWLSDIGYVDFAGATVVHLIGGGAAFVAILMIGPRLDRFHDDGTPRTMASHSSIMSLQGALLLTFGWIGFNAGTVSVSSPQFSEIIVNTFSCAAFGALGGSIIGVWLDKGVFNPYRIINGLLAGLVTSTAAIHVMHAYESMLVGFLGGALATWAAQTMLDKFKFDDPVDVVATHGIAGIFGALIFAFVAPVDQLVNGSRFSQLGIQLAGVGVILLLVTSTMYALLKGLSYFMPLRVSADDERIGLNYSEHGESIGTDRLKRALNERIDATDSSNMHLALDDSDEHADLAETVNRLIDRHESARATLEASEKKFQQFAYTASDFLWETTADMRLGSFNFSGNKDLDDAFANVKNKHFMDVIRLKKNDKAVVQKLIDNKQPFFSSNASFEPADGISILVEIRGAPNIDSEGNFLGYRGTLADVTDKKNAEEKAVYLSMHDELTGLLNRRALTSDLETSLDEAKSAISRLALITLDLDGFKAVNDSYGHNAGDDLLITVAQRISNFLSESSQLYRTGGDEFVLTIQNLQGENFKTDVQAIAGNILDSLRKPFALSVSEVKIAASVGVAVFPDDATSSHDLLRRSDLAMYSAKFQGKSRTVWFDKALDNEMDHRFKLETELKRAIAEHELYLLYQPLVDTETEELVSFEALVRWNHPTKGELAPNEFIGIIEKHKLMGILGDFVLDNACKFAANWQIENDLAPKLCVNISPSHLQSEKFISSVIGALEKNNCPPDRLELEITEEALIDSHEKALQSIETLENKGVSFSIDDFGTGQTSLRYLSNFPVGTMKIDRSFIKNIGKNDRASEITKSMIIMGTRLGYSVVAEGVENTQQLEMLRHWKCPVVQGYLFSKPVSTDQAHQMLQELGNSTTSNRLPKAG